MRLGLRGNVSIDISSIRKRISTFVVALCFAAMAVAHPSTDLDDHGDDPSTATGMSLGETASGEIDPGHDEDYFRLDLPRRATVAISGTRDKGQSLATSLLRMEGEYETCLAIHIHGRDPTRRELPRGTYYLNVSNIQPESGLYGLTVREVGRDDHGGLPETATDLALGTTVSGTIEPAGDTDFFRLELPKRTTLEVAGAGAEPSPAVRICEPERRDFDFALTDGDGEGGWSRRELEAGTYYLAVRSRGLAGAYELGVRDVGRDDHGDSRASATPLALDETAAGEIDLRGDLDYFRFELPSRTDMTVSATADAGINFGLAHAIEWDAADALGLFDFGEDDGQGGLRLRGVLDAGTYYLRMWRLDEAPFGSYEVVVRKTPPDDHGNSKAEATAIDLGVAVPGEIDPDDDVDYFRFELEQRATVVVATKGAAETGVLTDVKGQALSESEWLPELAEFQLRGDLDAGIHYVRLASGGSTGRYEIVVREAEPDDHGNRPDTATVVALGGMAEGAIERRDDVDYFRLDLARPAVVAVSVTSNFDNAELHFLDAEGATVREGYGVARTDLRTRAELGPGTYYLAVASYRSVTSLSYTPYCRPPQYAHPTGRYRLSVWEVAPDDHGGIPVTASDVPLDSAARGVIGSIEGEIDPREDRDVFRLELARRTDLIIDVVSGFPPLTRILNADGTEIDSEIVINDGTLEETIVLTEVCDDWTMKLVQPNSGEGQLQIRYEAHPGVYYVKLSSENGAGYYAIEVRESEPDDR